MFSRLYLHQIFISQKDLGSKNHLPSFFSPSKDKIVIQISFKQVLFNSKKHLLPAFFLLELISGQKPQLNFSKKDCSFLKVRKGSLVSISVTLHKHSLFLFLEKLVFFSFSKEKPFNFFNSCFTDSFGNEAFSVKSSLLFPDVEREFTLFINLFKQKSPYILGVTISHGPLFTSEGSLADYQFPYTSLFFSFICLFIFLELS